MESSNMVCPICGGTGIVQYDILWPELIETWDLTSDEVQLINRQQGQCCSVCGSNLRSRTLAGALTCGIEKDGAGSPHRSRWG